VLSLWRRLWFVFVLGDGFIVAGRLPMVDELCCPPQGRVEGRRAGVVGLANIDFPVVSQNPKRCHGDRLRVEDCVGRNRLHD